MNAALKIALSGVGMALLAGTAWWAIDSGPASISGGAVRAPAAAARQVPKDLPCSQVLHCVAVKMLDDAGTQCRSGIEQLAVYAPRWTNAPGNSIFTDFAWANQQQGTVTYKGNRAEFRNGSGGTTPISYECDYDTVGKRVLDVRAKGASMT